MTQTHKASNDFLFYSLQHQIPSLRIYSSAATNINLKTAEKQQDAVISSRVDLRLDALWNP